MLLSSDWFFPKWELIGLRTPSHTKLHLQMVCRTLTVEFLAGEHDYWMISFAPARIHRTEGKFFAALGSSELSESDLDVLRNIAERDADVERVQFDTSILVSLTLHLTRSGAESATESLGERVLSEVRSAVRILELDTDGMTEEWLCSNSDWDQQLRQATADLPEYIADFAEDLVTGTDKFNCFWKTVTGELDAEERASLANWYREAALDLAGQTIELPSE